MKDYSSEEIEIGGKTYTLFLNRKGIVAYEKYIRQEQNEVNNLLKEAQKAQKQFLEIKDDTNPFEDSDNVISSYDIKDRQEQAEENIFSKLYWILLYTNHPMKFEEAKDLYKQACEIYGQDNVRKLGLQMIEDANRDRLEKNKTQTKLKKLGSTTTKEISKEQEYISYTELYLNELFPSARLYGMTAKEFWEDDPQLFWSYRILFEKKEEIEAEKQRLNCWLNAKLNFVGQSLVLANGFSKKGTPFKDFPTFEEIFGKIEKIEKTPKDIDLLVQEQNNYWARF